MMVQPSMGLAEDEDKVMVPGNDMVPSQDDSQISFDDISSPLNSNFLDLYDPDLFAGETLTTSEVASSSNCCYEENNSYSNHHPHHIHLSVNEVDPRTNTLSLTCGLQNDLDDDISDSINFSMCPQVTPYFSNTYSPDGLDFSQIQVPHKSCFSVTLDGFPPYPTNNVLTSQLPAPVFEDDCLSSMHSLDPSLPTCSCLDYFSLRPLSNLSPAELSAVGGGEMSDASNLFIGDSSGLYCPHSLQRAFHSNEIQAMCGEGAGQWMRPGSTNENNFSKEMLSLEEPNYKAGKLSVEQRKEKIHRYMNKRNQRNFKKKIKYACRKTLADSRPRVRGRFAKNDEYVEHSNQRGNYCHCDHEEDNDDVCPVKIDIKVIGTIEERGRYFGFRNFCSHLRRELVQVQQPNPVMNLNDPKKNDS